MNRSFPLIFGGVIAFVLLILYAGLVFYMINDVRSGKGEFTSGMIYVVTTIGGLVAALVVSRLAITKPGENPAILKMSEQPAGTHNRWIATLAMLYLGVWMITGLAALIIGVIFYPDVSATLSDIGTTWLGLAVASGYAYFGIDPKA